MARWAIVVHGGCGRWEAKDATAALAGVRAAAAAARRVLADGGRALDAVCAAVVVLEDDPIFNAGTGCALNRAGTAEMDAAVMTGEDLHCGGVAAITGVKNPVLVARKVMEATPHVLLAGAGATAFARAQGFVDYDPVTRASLRRFRLRAAAVPPGTVGAVALDAGGRLAAATSTGGVSLKLPGRVGDSPIPGAGNYATPHAAASATGTGELMMRTLATKSACDLIAARGSARRAAVSAIRALPAQARDCGGMIVLDARGRVGIAMRGGVMPHAWCTERATRIAARLRA
ncbi:MAG TPA: isoaspartyl peptidase/L-asparaginase [Burkholderiales bacterium]|jgi:beta-aspartyl-peptidase (threonine type)|nr:isoaspartyl peptidase/L-asparaginase [Burkholderiales bacterium]